MTRGWAKTVFWLFLQIHSAWTQACLLVQDVVLNPGHRVRPTGFSDSSILERMQALRGLEHFLVLLIWCIVFL